MSWFTDLAGRAESLLNNLDEQTGVALRNHNGKKIKHDKPQYANQPHTLYTYHADPEGQRTRRLNYNPTSRNIIRKIPPVNETKSANYQCKKSSPTRTRSLFKDGPAEPLGLKAKKSSPTRSKVFNLHNCPRTMVDDYDISEEQLGFTRRRHNSLPSDIDMAIICNDNDIPLHLQNLEVENAMLKNELNVMNGEVTMMLEKLKHTEEGNDVDSVVSELSKTRLKLHDSEMEATKINQEKESLNYQLNLLKEKIQEIAVLEQNFQGEKQSILQENSALRDANNYLEDRTNDLKKKLDLSNVEQHKLETDLRHAQTMVKSFEEELEKSKGENQKLEKDWETYKLRVKSMLAAKDNEIKALQDGINFSEDAKELVQQLDSLKMERDELSEAIGTVKSECDGMRLCLSQVESRHTAAERVIAALRDTLKEERSARNRAETQYYALNKELKNIQNETGQTIASLRTALRDKETELAHVKETSSSIKSPNTSALNVADYDVTRDTIENEKIHYLTETLVQRQARVDNLMSENNMLKIQLDKLENKLKVEASNRTVSSQSVVNFQNADIRARKLNNSDSIMRVISHRMAAVIRRHPVLRIFIVIYMICLHFWVLTVLLSSTPPENFMPNFSRS